MPYWKPNEIGKLIKRTKHKAWCILCGEEQQKGDIIVRHNKHGVRLVCLDCWTILEDARELLKLYNERIK